MGFCLIILIATCQNRSLPAVTLEPCCKAATPGEIILKMIVREMNTSKYADNVKKMVFLSFNQLRSESLLGNPSSNNNQQMVISVAIETAINPPLESIKYRLIVAKSIQVIHVDFAIRDLALANRIMAKGNDIYINMANKFGWAATLKMRYLNRKSGYSGTRKANQVK